MQLKQKLFLLYGLCGLCVLSTLVFLLRAELREYHLATIEAGIVKQLENLDFSLNMLVNDVKHGVSVLAQNETVRTRNDLQFTRFLDADEEHFVYHIGEAEQAIIDIFHLYRLTHRHIGSVYMGRENGSFVRSHKRFRPTRYDPRTRPWYLLAKAYPDQVVVTAPYRAVTTPDVNIGVAKALVDDQQSVYGVVGADITLQDLTRYVSGYRIEEKGTMMLTDSMGNLLAAEQHFSVATNLIDILHDHSRTVIEKNRGSFLLSEASGQQFGVFLTSAELGWKIIALIPMDHIESRVNRAIWETVCIVCIGLAVFLVIVFLGMQHYVLRPLRMLQQGILQVTRTGDYAHRLPVSRSDEIGTLTSCFNEMMDSIRTSELALQQTTQALEEHRQHLEEVVQERTAELKTANQNLSEALTANQISEQRYRSLFDNAPEGIVLIDEKDHVVRVNEEFVRMFGFQPEEVLGHSLDDTIIPEHLRTEGQQLKRSIMESRRSVTETLRKRKDGSLIPVSVTGAPIVVNHRVTGVYAIYRDITELKEAESKLKQAKEAAEAANRAKSLFLANMSHEIRTPMNAILGYTQLMQQDPSLSTDLRQHLDTISRSGNHLLSLINDILEMSKIEAGRIELHPAVCDLHSMLGDIRRMFDMRTQAKGLSLEFICEKDVPRYMILDEGKLRQVIINLLANGVKFTEQGKITLHVAAEPVDTEAVSDETSRHYRLQFSVEDTGPGIQPEDLELIFRSFEQTDIGRHKEGTGLGLAICRAYVNRMGGTISVESQVGKGSLFRFFILAQTASQQNEPRSQPLSAVRKLAVQSVPLRILVADDNAANRDILTRMLERVGFEVRQAQNGEECLELHAQWHPHVVLMDIRMPVMDGVEATRRIKASAIGKGTIVIAVSASALEEQKTAVLKYGADAFIRKPFIQAEVLSEIQRLTGIEYEHEGIAEPERETAETDTVVSRLDITSIPRHAIESLRQAIEAGYHDDLLSAIDRLADSFPEAARKFRPLAEEFRYDDLLNLLNPRDSTDKDP